MARKRKKKQSLTQIITELVIAIILIICGCYGYSNMTDETQENAVNQAIQTVSFDLSSIPDYSGELYVVINNNIPNFDEEDYNTESFEEYSNLDSLGRCGVAYANICRETMPPEGDERGDISSVKPTGWVQAKYNGEYLYNRCHLIGYQLSDEDANELNIITGTRYFNVSGMLPFENQVAEYITNQEENENRHVLYRVTPIYEGDNLLVSRCTNGGIFS